MKKLLAEALGTFTLVFAGTGAIVINEVSGGAVTHAGIALTFGLVVQSFVLELVLTAILMLTILSVSTGGKEKGVTAGIAIGSVIALEAMFAGPVSGASMNPARSLAPALVSGSLEHLWIYLAAPALGALLAIPLCKATRCDGCCPPLHPS
ncbi:MAG TPA: hypothetical protein DIT13_07905 [Verrucomicrobiales bacterium]|nr:hypothetical protein [Verrucomicrobiales bacterium]